MATLQTNGSAADLQAKINSANDRDVIQLPAGTFDWTGGGQEQVKNHSDAPGKAITIQGAGPTQTTLKVLGHKNNGKVIGLYGSLAGVVRITGIRFEGYGGLGIWNQKDWQPTRVDHCNFYTTTWSCTQLMIDGDGPELVDHCKFEAGGMAESIHHNGLYSDSGWKDDVSPASVQSMYIEDCEFHCLANDSYTSGVQSFYSARICVRYCKFYGAQIDVHGTAGMVGGRWGEYYENEFYAHPTQGIYMDVRAGSGVIYNNYAKGGATGIFRIREEDSGYPALYQVGRGINQNPSPLYVWHNDFALDYYTPSMVAPNRDVFESASQPAKLKVWQQASHNAQSTITYSPYVYPHPLQSGELTQPPVTPQPPPEVADGTELDVAFGQNPINLSAAGDYSLEATVIGPSEAANSLWIDFDDDPKDDDKRCWDLQITSSPISQPVNWRGNALSPHVPPEFAPKVWTLTAGEHILHLVAREPDTQIKKVRFTKTGSNQPNPELVVTITIAAPPEVRVEVVQQPA